MCSSDLALLAILPGGIAYLGWSRYVAAVTGLGKTTVGSEIHEVTQGQAMAEGVAQLLGFMEPTEKFAQVRDAMFASPFTIPVCLLGGGALALALIWLVLAAAALAAPKGERLRPVCLGVFGTLALGAFLIFHLFLYVYNFRETDAANLQDYIRYIGPYYMGFFLMALGLLARYAAAESRAAKLAGAVPAGRALALLPVARVRAEAVPSAKAERPAIFRKSLLLFISCSPSARCGRSSNTDQRCCCCGTCRRSRPCSYGRPCTYPEG